MEAESIAEAPLAEKTGGLKGAHAMVAINDERLGKVVTESGHCGFRETGEGNQFSALKTAEVEFIGFAAID